MLTSTFSPSTWGLEQVSEEIFCKSLFLKHFDSSSLGTWPPLTSMDIDSGPIYVRTSREKRKIKGKHINWKKNPNSLNREGKFQHFLWYGKWREGNQGNLQIWSRVKFYSFCQWRRFFVCLFWFLFAWKTCHWINHENSWISPVLNIDIPREKYYPFDLQNVTLFVWRQLLKSAKQQNQKLIDCLSLCTLLKNMFFFTWLAGGVNVFCTAL